MKAPRSGSANAPHGRPLSPPTQDYLTVPYRLITDLHDNQLALGLYSLVARLYLVEQRPIPLSTIDVQRYDPRLSRGAILRAFARLVRGGWLLEQEQTGRKTCYTPCWGLVGGAPRPWAMEAPSLGRPRHIHALRLERRLLDTYMGRLTTHTTRGALVERYVSQPLLGLSDVGAYLLALHGQPATTPQLVSYGLLARGQAQPLPADETILAQASQRCLEDAGALSITEKGFRKLGCPPAPPASEGGKPLFFVPPAMIGSVIAPVIGSDDQRRQQLKAIAKAKIFARMLGRRIPGNQFKSDQISPLPPSKATRGGGKENQSQDESNQERAELPDTPTSTLLRAINVRPAVVRELSPLPSELVQSAIDDGRSRQGILDLAGWVVSMLRDARDHGWEIGRTGHSAEEELRERIARAKASGLFRSDDDLAVFAPPPSAPGLAPSAEGAQYDELTGGPARSSACASPGLVARYRRDNDVSPELLGSLKLHADGRLPGPDTSIEGLLNGQAGPSGGCSGVPEGSSVLSPLLSRGHPLAGAWTLSPNLEELRQDLLARARPAMRRLIAGLELRWSDGALLVLCFDAHALREAQQLLPLIRSLLSSRVAAVPRIAVLLRPTRS